MQSLLAGRLPFRIVVMIVVDMIYDIYWPDPQQPHHADIAFFRRS